MSALLGDSRMPVAALSWDARPAHAGAVVLVLHGGAVDGRQRNRVLSPNVLRLVPFARALAKIPGPIAVARVRFRYRGWNGEEESPITDGRWALDQARAAYPGRPIALVGHSMGGRVALYLGDEPDVRLVLGLAPWIEQGDPWPHAGCRTVIVHGDRDIICPVWASRLLVEKMTAEGQAPALIRVARSDHAMVVRARLWTAVVTGVVQQVFATELGAPAGQAGFGSDESTHGEAARAVRAALTAGGVVDV